jgi:hypothetical protein
MYTVNVVRTAFSFVLFCISPYTYVLYFPVLSCIFLYHGMMFIIFPGSSCMPICCPSFFYCSCHLSLYSPALSRLSRVFFHSPAFSLRFPAFLFVYVPFLFSFRWFPFVFCALLHFPAFTSVFLCCPLFFFVFMRFVSLFCFLCVSFVCVFLLFPVFLCTFLRFCAFSCSNVTARFFSHKKQTVAAGGPGVTLNNNDKNAG